MTVKPVFYPACLIHSWVLTHKGVTQRKSVAISATTNTHFLVASTRFHLRCWLCLSYKDFSQLPSNRRQTGYKVGQSHISPTPFFIRQWNLWFTCRFYSAPSSPLVSFGLLLDLHNIKHFFLVFKKIPSLHDQICDSVRNSCYKRLLMRSQQC